MLTFRFARIRVLPMLIGICALSAVAPLQASSIQTFQFSGACVDCSGNGTASLQLTGYTPGTAILASNLVRFDYNGTNLLAAFTILAAAPGLAISGNIPNGLPLPADFHISAGSNTFTLTIDGGLTISPLGLASVTLPFFNSFTNGNWSAGDNGAVGDFGTGGTFNALGAVPEPASVLLIGAGLAALGLRRFKR